MIDGRGRRHRRVTEAQQTLPNHARQRPRLLRLEQDPFRSFGLRRGPLPSPPVRNDSPTSRSLSSRKRNATAMIEFLDFLLDILVLGDSFASLRRISDGDDAERESRLYAAPEMRRLRWIARMVVFAYLVTVIALPFLLAAY